MFNFSFFLINRSHENFKPQNNVINQFYIIVVELHAGLLTLEIEHAVHQNIPLK